MQRSLLALLLSLSGYALALNSGLGPVPDSVDRESPLSSVHGFLTAAHAGDYDLAAHYLDLDKLPVSTQAVRGPQLARRLKFVLDRKVLVDLSSLSREPEGDQNKPNLEQ